MGVNVKYSLIRAILISFSCLVLSQNRNIVTPVYGQSYPNKAYPIKADDFNPDLKTFEPWSSLTQDKDNFFTGLYCPADRISQKIAGVDVTSGVVYDFANVYNNAPLVIRYKRTALLINGDSCQGSSCGKFPYVHVFVSSNKTDWIYVRSLPDTVSEQYRIESFTPNQSYRYVAVCRGSGNSAQDNIAVNSIYAETENYQDIYRYYVEKYLNEQIDINTNSYIHSTQEADFNGLAVQCSILTSAYKLYNKEEYKEKAKAIGDYLILNKDLNGNAKVGWGLPPNYIDTRRDATANGNVLRCNGNPGEWDAFGDHTCNPQNTEYIFQTARVVRSLADLYLITKDDTYLNVAKEAVTDSWDRGMYRPDINQNCFYYWYSYHPNDENRFVRNTNLEMADALAYLYYVTGDESYKTRASQCLSCEIAEQDAGNKGYLGIKDRDFSETQRLKTQNHYPSHGFYIHEVNKIINKPEYNNRITGIMNDWRDCRGYCQSGNTLQFRYNNNEMRCTYVWFTPERNHYFCETPPPPVIPRTSYYCSLVDNPAGDSITLTCFNSEEGLHNSSGPRTIINAANSQISYTGNSWSGDLDKYTDTYTFHYCFLKELSDDMRKSCLHELNDLGGGAMNWFEPWTVIKNFIDFTAPTAPALADEGQFTASRNQLNVVSCRSEDQESGIVEYQYRITQDSPTGQVIREWTSTGGNFYSGGNNTISAGGLNLIYGKTYYFGVKAKNGAGLWSQIGYSDGITVLTPPSVPSNLTATNPSSGQIKLTWQDNSSDESGFKIECKVGASANFSEIASVRANVNSFIHARVTSGPPYSYRIRAYNAAGNSAYSNTATFTINAPPRVGTITPSRGSSLAGSQAVDFTTTYSDPNGWQDISYVELVINTAADGRNCFYGYYAVNVNKIYLRNDANSTWVSEATPGSSAIIQNSYAVLDCSKTTVSGTGDTLTINWNIIFKGSFVGPKNSYLWVTDKSGAFQGYVNKGTWEVGARVGLGGLR